jgi:hypothetical protein
MSQPISRSRFLQRAAALGLVAATAGTVGATSATAGTTAAGTPYKRRLDFRGVAYDTGTGFSGDESRVLWRPDIVRGELSAIRHRLHANWVSIYGTQPKRLRDTATEALRQGLHVSIQPRFFDEPQADSLRKLADVARDAERLRCRYGPEVILVIGCEFMLFTPGIVPGADFFERVEHLTNGNPDMPAIVRRFRAYTAKMVKVARSNFHGRITYGAASDLEPVDWALFDIVGLDYYSYHADPAEHATELAPFRKWGKPIMILEFGCCTFTGAAEAGGMGWDIVDYTVDPPVIKDGYVRNEQEQAMHLANMLGVFAKEGMLGASPYTFISPDAPHRADDPQHDDDIAGYGLVKVIREDSWDPASPYRWEPKKSFQAVREIYRRG